MYISRMIKSSDSADEFDPMVTINRVKPQKFVFEDDGEVPNSTLPVHLYEGVLDFHDLTREQAEEAINQLVATNGWYRDWTYYVYPSLHYHSTAHEGLIVFQGRATIQIGGKNGRMFTVKTGDVVIVPAGVGHERILASATDDERRKEIEEFIVFGVYPKGQKWDFISEEPNVEDGALQLRDPAVKAAAIERIARVPVPATDPILSECIFKEEI